MLLKIQSMTQTDVIIAIIVLSLMVILAFIGVISDKKAKKSKPFTGEFKDFKKRMMN